MLKTDRRKICTALVLNLITLLICRYLMYPFWETNDDSSISRLIDGSKIISDPHMVYENVIYGTVLKALYRFHQSFPWYAWLQYLMIFAALTAIVYVLLQRLEPSTALVLSIVTLVFFGYEGYVRLQFTKTTGIVASGAIFLLLWAVSQEKIRWKAGIFAFVLALSISLLRISQFYACGALLAVIGFSLLLHLNEVEKGKRLRRFGRYVITFGLLVVCAFGLTKLDYASYRADADWDYHYDYDNARAAVLDYGIPDYDTYKEQYQELGLDRAAIALLSTYNLGDRDVFDTDTLNAIASFRPKKGMSLATVKAYLHQFPWDFRLCRTFFYFLTVFFVWLLLRRHDWKDLLCGLAEIGFFGAIYFYLFYIGRFLVNRVDVGLWLACSLVFLWLMKPERSLLARRHVLPQVLLIAVVFFAGMVYREDGAFSPIWRNTEEAKNYQVSQANATALLEAAAADPDHLYLCQLGTLSEGTAYGPFDTPRAGVLNNILWLGGWESFTKGYLATMDQYGIRNVYPDMIGNEKVRVVAGNIALITDYLHSRYSKDAKATKVGDIGGFGVYEISGTLDK